MGKIDAIEEFKQKLHQIESQGSAPMRAPVWQRFDELVNKMSNDQQAFVNGNEKALAKRQQMMATFNDWLFERFKDEFVQIPVFAALAEEYVDVVANTAQEFGRHAAGLEKENEELRRQLAELRAERGDRLL